MSEASWLWRYKQNSVENRVFWKICVLPKKSWCANSFERDCNVASAYTLCLPNILLHYFMMSNLSSIVCLFAPHGSPTFLSSVSTSIEPTNIDSRFLKSLPNLSFTPTATLVSLLLASRKSPIHKAIRKPQARVVKKNVRGYTAVVSTSGLGPTLDKSLSTPARLREGDSS